MGLTVAAACAKCAFVAPIVIIMIQNGTNGREGHSTALDTTVRAGTSMAGHTGRIARTLSGAARRVLFESVLEEQIRTDLPHISQIDMAHVLMLAESQIVDHEVARTLLRAICRLVQREFADLKGRPALRGLFLMYEGYFIEAEGSDIGGILQTGRSRNDLNATSLKLRLREPYSQFMNEALRLQAVLLRRAKRYRHVIMPAYTHGQPAEPITYGHYLAGVASAISRDVDGLIAAASEIDTCPLGAGAVAGTSLPINPSRTARLLGFARTSPNSVDAVASRDLVLRLLAAMAIFGATLSRIATDLLQWLTAEFQFLSLPDEMVGSSSAMPQKRNPFILEHVQGRSASAAGAFAAALGSIRNISFTNSIAVGTESVAPLWRSLKDISQASTLLRLVLFHAKPNPERMLLRATEGFTTAASVAARMVLENGMSFRASHNAVGRAVTRAISKGFKSLEELPEDELKELGLSLSEMDPASCVARASRGAGPACESLEACVKHLSDRWLEHRRWLRSLAVRWKERHLELQHAVQKFCTG